MLKANIFVHKLFMQFVISKLPTLVKKIKLKGFEVEIYTSNRLLVPLLKVLKNHLFFQYKCLSDLFVVDNPRKVFRFRVVYNLLSIKFNSRLNVSIQANEKTFVNSVVPLYSNASWLERESLDMFGVFFANNKDMRRILTDYGFLGYPLRKDFPLSGFVEVFFSQKKNKIVQRPSTVAQEYRLGLLTDPWDMQI